MNKTDVKEIVRDEINRFVDDLLDNEIKKILAKSGSKSRTEVVNTIKNAMEAVYKVLWQKEISGKQI